MSITEEGFLKDVSCHQMTVLRDEGVFRHVRFSRPDSSSYRFDLITWPRHLKAKAASEPGTAGAR